MQNFDYIIIGGGCFGVSTALALQRARPNAKTILFEGSETKTASKGIRRIIRAPYMDEEYVLLAKDAKKIWEGELPYCNFYHRAGWIQVVRGNNYVPFPTDPEERLIKAEELSHMVNSRDLPRLDTGEELWLNEDIGVADAARALEAVAVEAEVQGVIRQKTNVSQLLIEDGVCYGVECVGGMRVTAETTIVATGAWTPALLESSRIRLPHDIQHDFLSVTAIGVATLPLDGDEYTKFKSMPILVTEHGVLTSLTGLQRLTYYRRSNASSC